MQKFFLILLTPLAIFHAEGFYDAGIEGLYIKPSACEFDYGTLGKFSDIEFTNVTTVSTEKVKPSYGWGLRVFVGWEDKCRDLFSQLDWVYIHSTARSSFDASAVVDTAFLPFIQEIEDVDLTGTGSLRYRYNRINWRWGRYFHQCCWGEFYFFSGLSYVELRQKRKFASTFGVGGVRSQFDHARFDGAALELGIGGEMALLCNFNLAGYAGILAALGSQRLHGMYVQNQDSARRIDLNAKSITRCLPGLELRLGINYAVCCGCFEGVMEVGYELNHYFGILSNYKFDSIVLRNEQQGEGELVGQLATECRSVGFSGLYGSLKIYF